LARRAAEDRPILGICGGYQLLGRTIDDPVESRAGLVDGLGLLPVDTTFAPDKVLALSTGRAAAWPAIPVAGYEIHHGRTARTGGAPLFLTATGEDGCEQGAVRGTTWHGCLEQDVFRRALLLDLARRCSRRFVPADTSFAARREERLDALADLVADGLDTAWVDALLAGEGR
ncbi:MAG: cobyric acid synthase, partial [Mycobacteriales bacterium]